MFECKLIDAITFKWFLSVLYWCWSCSCFKGKYDDHLVVALELNPEPIRIHLLGHGTEPSIEISETFLKFNTSCPYPEEFSKPFTVRNAGKMPVEIYLPDFDA